MRIHRRDDGFTLVELMIVVALIGVLAAIAIPSFLSYQARSRRTEAFTNLSALARTQKTLQATKGAYHDSGLPFPDSLPYGGLGAHKMDWDAASEAAFGELGWAPEGQVHYSYHDNTTDNCSCTLCFTSTAYGDVDSDGRISALMYVEPQRDSAGAIAGECASGMPGAFNFGTPTGLSGGPIYSQVAIQRSTDEY